jgi:hypothetical protein
MWRIDSSSGYPADTILSHSLHSNLGPPKYESREYRDSHNFCSKYLLIIWTMPAAFVLRRKRVLDCFHYCLSEAGKSTEILGEDCASQSPESNPRALGFFLLLYSLILGLGRLHETFRSISVTRSRTVGRTPWTGDQLIARPLLPAPGECDDDGEWNEWFWQGKPKYSEEICP